MRDIQSESDTRAVPLQKVGVKGVKYPVVVLDKTATKQHSTAKARTRNIFNSLYIIKNTPSLR